MQVTAVRAARVEEEVPDLRDLLPHAAHDLVGGVRDALGGEVVGARGPGPGRSARVLRESRADRSREGAARDEQHAPVPDRRDPMHDGAHRGYHLTMLFALFADTTPADGDASPLASRADVLALLRRQHDDLHTALARLPGLRGAAREDEFLQARRHLAVHQSLVDQLFSQARSGPAEEGRGPDDEVLVAERLTAASDEFGTAVDRVLSSFLAQDAWLHAAPAEESRPLTRGERAVAETAEALWYGEGDAYLGNDYREMRAAARSQLAEAAREATPRGA